MPIWKRETWAGGSEWGLDAKDLSEVPDGGDVDCRKWSTGEQRSFLLLALGLSALGTAVLVWRNRQPNRIETGINEFHREMRALAPESTEGGVA